MRFLIASDLLYDPEKVSIIESMNMGGASFVLTKTSKA